MSAGDYSDDWPDVGEPTEKWIVIPKWDGADGFQHYKNRDPIWIKAYTRLLSDRAFLSLTYHQRGLLLSIWLEYARGNRQLSDSTVGLTRQLGQRVLRRDLEALSHAGFITFSASRPLAPRYQDASPEKRREEKTFTSSTTRATAPAPKPATRTLPWRCTICPERFDFKSGLAQHLDLQHDVTVAEREQLIADARPEAEAVGLHPQEVADEIEIARLDAEIAATAKAGAR